MKNLITTFSNKKLPVIQTKFVNSFDGSIESLLKFEQLHLVLNPTFSRHYFFISGTRDEDTITTKHTDGSTAASGSQTPEMESNSALLAHELKKEFKKMGVCNALGNSLTKGLNEKIHVKINEEVVRIKGLKTNNLF